MLSHVQSINPRLLFCPFRKKYNKLNPSYSLIMSEPILEEVVKAENDVEREVEAVLAAPVAAAAAAASEPVLVTRTGI